MKCKLSFLLAVLLAFLALLPGCGNAFGTKIASVSVNGGYYYPIYVYQITDISKDEELTEAYTDWLHTPRMYSSGSFTNSYYSLNEDEKVSNILFVVTKSKLELNENYTICFRRNNDISSDFVAKGIVKKVVKEFGIQKKDSGDTFIITYYNIGSSDTVFRSEKEAKEAVQNAKTTVEVVKENVVIYYE